MKIPLGAWTHADGSVELVTEFDSLPATLIPDPRLCAADDAATCETPDYCRTYGCWCLGLPAGDTYRCANCNECWAAEYQCALWAAMCPRCCSHRSCFERFERATRR